MTTCQLQLMEAGKPYPRTCAECGLSGPCRFKVEKPATTTTPNEAHPEWEPVATVQNNYPRGVQAHLHRHLPFGTLLYGPAVKTEMLRAQEEARVLREALKAVLPYVATGPIGCHGYKCRKPWCWSCNGEEEAAVAAKNGLAAYTKARTALKGTP